MARIKPFKKKNWDDGLNIKACAPRDSTFYIMLSRQRTQRKIMEKGRSGLLVIHGKERMTKYSGRTASRLI